LGNLIRGFLPRDVNVYLGIRNWVVKSGEDRAILTQRQAVYEAAKAKKPERWSRHTRNWDWQPKVCLNPDKPNNNAAKKTDTTVH